MKARRPAPRRRPRRQKASAIEYLVGASMLGGLIGVGMTDRGGEFLLDGIQKFQTATGPTRTREPQPGDHWSGCNSARAAGTAPIYSGEPGYREGMDGDGDGVACEPY